MNSWAPLLVLLFVLLNFVQILFQYYFNEFGNLDCLMENEKVKNQNDCKLRNKVRSLVTSDLLLKTVPVRFRPQPLCRG